jgi:hypothetical protein
MSSKPIYGAGKKTYHLCIPLRCPTLHFILKNICYKGIVEQERHIMLVFPRRYYLQKFLLKLVMRGHSAHQFAIASQSTH